MSTGVLVIMKTLLLLKFFQAYTYPSIFLGILVSLSLYSTLFFSIKLKLKDFNSFISILGFCNSIASTKRVAKVLQPWHSKFRHGVLNLQCCCCSLCCIYLQNEKLAVVFSSTMQRNAFNR